MARVFFPPALRRFTEGLAEVEVQASDVRGLIRELDARFPGIGERLGQGMAVAIDGEIIPEPLLEPVEPESEIHFLPPVSGG